MLPFLLVTYNTACKSLFCGQKPWASPGVEFKAVRLSIIHPSILSSPFPTAEVTRSGGGTHPSQVTSPMRHEKSKKNLYRSRSEFHMGGRTEVQTLTDEADRILNVIYLTTECCTRSVHGGCDSLRRTNRNPLRTRWVIELGMKTQTVGTHNRGIRGKSSRAKTWSHFQGSRRHPGRFDRTSDMTKQRSDSAA